VSENMSENIGSYGTGYAFNQPRMEHIAVWAKDIDKTAAFLEKALGWKRHPMVFGVAEDNPVFGGMELAFIDANGLWVELVQPTTDGPGMEFLNQKGDGAIVELDFFLDDFKAHLKDYEARGIELIGMDGLPLQNGGLLSEWVLIDGEKVPADEFLSYLPFDLARGTSIELATEDINGAVILRDTLWKDSPRTPKSAPHTDYVAVLAEDFEKSLNVYTDILNLKKSASDIGVRREWMGFDDQEHAWIEANHEGTWIELISPKGSSKGVLAEQGDGAIIEIGVEVQDIAQYAKELEAKGITMTAGDDVALPVGEVAVTDPKTGDRYAYLPLEQSEGMRIMIFQRGGPESAFNKR
jgi:catechol 2,3-dioxygenase-like lactoylglutathione lyase family enzyme